MHAYDVEAQDSMTWIVWRGKLHQKGELYAGRKKQSLNVSLIKQHGRMLGWKRITRRLATMVLPFPWKLQRRRDRKLLSLHLIPAIFAAD